MRISLRIFLLMIVLAGAALGIYGRRLMEPDYHFVWRSLTTTHGSRYNCGILRERDSLIYCVLIPVSWNGASISARHSSDVGPSPITLNHDGIYVDSEPIPMETPVFVYTIDDSVRPVVLTDRERKRLQACLDPIRRNQSPNVPVWLNKVEPVIDEEYHRGPYAYFMHPEDCKYLKKKGDDGNEQ